MRWIWLRIDLSRYTCDDCCKRETNWEKINHDIRFIIALCRLFGHLKTIDDGHPGIMLELSAHSPSDSEHYCQELRKIMNDTMWHASDTYAAIQNSKDKAHEWKQVGGGHCLSKPI